MSRKTFGVGVTGQGEYSHLVRKINGKHTKVYSVWHDMLGRCYNKKYQEKKPTYIGCTVCEEWHNFQNFAKWYEENYYEVNNEEMALDKDILIKGNKIYSPQTLDEAVNLAVKRYTMFTENGIKVIRLGLHSIENEAYIAGPWHPAFSELCQSQIMLNKAIKLLKEKGYPWHYNHFFQLEIDLFPAYYKVQYERIENDTFLVFV